MCIHETEHYVFHVKQGSPAQRDIEQIACHQEGCFAHVTNCLGLVPKEKIHYFFMILPKIWAGNWK